MSAQKYYISMPHFEQLFDVIARKDAFKGSTKEEYALWKSNTRGVLRDILGISKMSPSSCFRAEKLETVEMDGYTRELWTIDTEPGVTMPFYVLLPQGMKPGRKYAAVITPHGHGSDGKNAVVGNRLTPGLADTIENHNYDYAVQLVRKGFITFAPDARGFGQRREAPLHGDEDQKRLTSSCQQLNNMAYGLGQTVTGMWAFDLIRLMDYICTLPFIDAARIGCAGLSGGGLQTLWLIAMDDRVACAVVSGYFYGYKEALLQKSLNCSCNYVPHLWEHVDMGDVAALFAPRPVLIETGDSDDLNGYGDQGNLENVASQLAITKQVYAVFGAQDMVAHSVFHGPHRWDGKDGIPWLVKWLKP